MSDPHARYEAEQRRLNEVIVVVEAESVVASARTVELPAQHPPRAVGRNTRVSRYDNDPRVCRAGHGFTVTRNGTVYRVLPSDTLGWGIYTGPNLTLAATGDGGLAIGYPTADHAIEALIGTRR